MSDPIILYQREDCQASGLIRKKLGELMLPVLIKFVPSDETERTELKQATDQTQIPALIDKQEVFAGFDAIAEHLKKVYGAVESKALSYGIETRVKGSFEQVRQQAIDAFTKKGFGLISEIDIKAKLKEKIQVEMEDYSILGMCNPKFAYESLQQEEDLGLLLPCNLIIRKIADQDYLVSVIDPAKLFSVVGREDMAPMAQQVKELLAGAIDLV